MAAFQSDFGEVIDNSDSESNASVVVGGRVAIAPNVPLFVSLPKGENARDVMEGRFLQAMESIGLKPRVVAIHRNACQSLLAVAKSQTFRIFVDTVAKIRDGNPNLAYAWYGASSVGELCEIVEHGFTGNNLNNGGLRLCPEANPIESVKRSVADIHGAKHMMLCRVILGRQELVQPNQWRPSSRDFDSGAVESLATPKEYIIWSSRMNTHVFPEFIMSFKLPVPGQERVGKPVLPSSQWMPFPSLIALLSRTLPSTDVTLLKKYHADYAERRITRLELIQKVRAIAGDPLLVAIIKTLKAKKIPLSYVKLADRKRP